MKKDKNAKSMESPYITSSRELKVINFIENQKDASEYMDILGAMIDRDASKEKRTELGQSRYDYVTGEITQSEWLNKLKKTNGENPKVQEYIQAYEQYQDTPNDATRSKFAIADISLMRGGKEMPYEKSLAMVSFALNEDKGDNLTPFHRTAKNWEHSLMHQNQYLEESFNKGNTNLIKEAFGTEKDESEYMPFESTLYAIETGLRTRISIVSDNESIINRSPTLKEKNANLVKDMSEDLIGIIGTSDLAEQGLALGKDMSAKSKKPKTSFSHGL